MMILAIPLIYLTVCYFFFLYTCGRGKELDWNDRSAVKKTPYGPYWDTIVRARAWLEEFGAEEISITSHDGLKLKGLWIPAENAKATVIAFHGYRSTYLVDFSGIYRLYHDQGYNLLLVRQRAHGESEGKYITFGVKERLDALDWIKFHNKAFGTTPVFISGMSMGAATVSFAAGEALPENVCGITADCGFSSPYDIIAHVAKGKMGSLCYVLLPGVDFWARVLAGFSLKQCQTTDTLARSTTPILMIHGLADDYVPSHMTQTGFDACQSEKELILVEGAGHGTSFLTDRPRVENALLEFFRRNTPNEVLS